MYSCWPQTWYVVENNIKFVILLPPSASAETTRVSSPSLGCAVWAECIAVSRPVQHQPLSYFSSSKTQNLVIADSFLSFIELR